MTPRIVTSVTFCVLLVWAARQSDALPPESHSAQMASAARRLLDLLSPDMRKKIQFSFDDTERKDWSNLPVALPPELHELMLLRQTIRTQERACLSL